MRVMKSFWFGQLASNEGLVDVCQGNKTITFITPLTGGPAKLCLPSVFRLPNKSGEFLLNWRLQENQYLQIASCSSARIVRRLVNEQEWNPLISICVPII